MSIDMSQFYQAFFEETQEHLKTLEALLLGLDLDHPDAEQLDAIFRAAHSIKGSSGTFGFTDLTAVTHILENLLDRLRKGELTPTGEMIDAFLDAGDVLALLLAGHRGDGAADPAVVEAICRRLKLLTEDVAPQTSRAAGDTRRLAGATDDAYGFFDDADRVTVAPVAAAANDTGYGFFDDFQAAAASASSAAGEIDAGYGFFDTALPAAGGPAKVGAGETASLPAAETGNAERRACDRRRDARSGAGADTSIRVGIDKVDQLINLVGELVITQAMLSQSAQGVDEATFERLLGGLSQLQRNTRDLQESVMSIRMMPMSVLFSRFPRVIRDLSQKLGKQVELKTIGESTELDKGLIERITDPLTHLIRNSLDHGIEMPEERIASGKPASGTITLKAYQQSGSIVIEVGDNGAGLNRARILAKARERGLPVSEQMSDADVWMLIFEAGFSTAERITEVSGRGVGMDVVKRNIAAIGGRVDIDSMSGVGTQVTVRLPLTLAILDGMSVAAGKETYIVPLGYVVESLQVTREMVKSLSGAERLIHMRGEYLPVIALYDLFLIPDTVTQLHRGIMVILESDGIKAALFVDALLGQHQVVIKSLEANYRKVPGIGGATIMGDGHVALILDVSALVQMAHSATLPTAALTMAA